MSHAGRRRTTLCRQRLRDQSLANAGCGIGCANSFVRAARQRHAANGVNERPPDAKKGERFKRDPKARVETSSRIKRRNTSVANEIFGLDDASERSRERLPRHLVHNRERDTHPFEDLRRISYVHRRDCSPHSPREARACLTLTGSRLSQRANGIPHHLDEDRVRFDFLAHALANDLELLWRHPVAQVSQA